MLTKQEAATVLAALRFYQAEGLGDPALRPEEIHEIATDSGDETSLDVDGIDELCEKINCDAPLTGEHLYQIYTEVNAESNCGVDDWADAEQAMWNGIAARI